MTVKSMKRIKLIIHHSLFIILAFVFAGEVCAQVTVQATLDSAQIYIGQRVGITLEVSADAASSVQLPRFDSLQQLTAGVEYAGCEETDTETLNAGKRFTLRKKYYITAFDSSLYLLPPMEVKVDTGTYASKPLALKVYTLDIDTLHVDSVFSMMEEMVPRFEWEEWNPLILWSVVVLILTLMLAYVLVRIKDNKPIIRRVRLKPRVAPHKVAMEKIAELRSAVQEVQRVQMVQGVQEVQGAQEVQGVQGESKEFYTQLTEALRQYISERFGFSAMEMTTAEIVEHLSSTDDKTAIDELTELFQTADLVKFAKLSTELSEKDRNLITAVDYINQTKQEEEPKPQPTEMVVVEERSKRAKLVLRISVTIVAVALAVALAYVVYKLVLLLI